MKKKLLMLSIIAAVAISAAGCGQQSNNESEATKKPEQVDASGAYEKGGNADGIENGSSAGGSTDENYSEKVNMDAVIGTEAKEQDDKNHEAEFGDYKVSIEDAKVIDYEGGSVAVVSFDYENNSSEAMPFTGAIVVEAYDANGNRLPQAVVSGVEGVELLAMSENVQPGEDITIQKAFKLSDPSQQFVIDVTAFDTSVTDLRLSKTFN